MSISRTGSTNTRLLWGVAVPAVVAAVAILSLTERDRPQGQSEAEDNCVQATDRIERGDTAGAEHYYRLALAADSTHPRASFGLARIAFAAGKYTPAAQLLRQAMLRDSDNYEIAYHLGLTFDRLQRPDSAAAYLRRAVELEPTFARGHYSLGMLWLNRQEPDSAVKYLESYLALGPTDPQSVREVQQLIEAIRYER